MTVSLGNGVDIGNIVTAETNPITGRIKFPSGSADALASSAAILFANSVVMVGDSNTAFGLESLGITSIARSGNVTTVTYASHGVPTDGRVSIYNVTPASFNVHGVQATKTGANTFTYPNIGPDESGAAIAGRTMYLAKWQRYQDKGVWTWLQSKASGNLTLLSNSGRGSQDYAELLTQYDTLVGQYAADVVIQQSAYNDIVVNGKTGATAFADAIALAEKAAAQGSLVVIVSAYPFTTNWTIARAGEMIAFNRLVREYCKTHINVLFADAASLFVDPMSASQFQPKANMLSDGIHITPLAAERVAQAIWDVLQGRVKQQSVLVTSNADTYGATNLSRNIWDIAPWTTSATAPTGTNATGVVASGLTVQHVAGAGSVVASTPARADGIGLNQRMVITAADSSDFFRVYGAATIGNTRYAPGDKIQLRCEVNLSGVGGSNFLGFFAYLNLQGAATYQYDAYNKTITNAAQFPQADGKMVLVSAPIEMPNDAVANVNFYVALAFAGLGTALTVDVGRVSIEKL